MTQSGGGTVASRFGYDTITGNVSEIDTFTSGIVDGTGKAATLFGFDPTTGMLSSKTFADGTRDTWGYNSKLQLSSMALPGVGGAFVYNTAGDMTKSTYTDTGGGGVGTVVDTVQSWDDVRIRCQEPMDVERPRQ